MSLKAVTYYEVECDDCGSSFADFSDYSGWSDRGQAIDEWVNHEGFILGEWALCYDHAPRCPHGYPQSADEDDDICDECEAG